VEKKRNILRKGGGMGKVEKTKGLEKERNMNSLNKPTTKKKKNYTKK